MVVLAVGALALVLLALQFVWTEQQVNRQRREEAAEIFAVYEPYGLIYDLDRDRLFYHNQLVRYFEDITDENFYTIWPQREGSVDVHTLRDAFGVLKGVQAFDEQAYRERTASLQNANGQLQISQSISIDGYTQEVEEQVKDRIEAAYLPYQPYGLRYVREEDRLYYEGDRVGYFEDTSIGHSFGPFDDSQIVIYAIRDSQGQLTGLDVRQGEDP